MTTTNTLTPLIPTFIATIQEILREYAPLPRIVNTDFSSLGAPLNGVITIPIVPAVAGEDIAPANVAPEATGRALTNVNVSITKARAFPFGMTGEDFLRATDRGAGFRSESIAQAVRGLVNEVHSDIAGQNIYASEAIGTPGTTPFGSNLDLAYDAEKLLNDSFAPGGNRWLVYDTAAKAALGKLGQLSDAYRAGSDQTLRQAIIGDIAGFSTVFASDIKAPAIGSGANYLINNGAGYAAGYTGTIVIDTGTGTLLAGDVVTIAGSTTKYVVASGTTTTLVLTQPLKAAIADNAAVTVLAQARRNMAFHRGAMVLVARPPAMPDGGDSATDRVLVTDPVSGLSMTFATYKQYQQVRYQVELAWGVKTVRPELLKLILG